MNLKKLIIIGTSTTAENIYKFVIYYNLFDVKGFAVDNKYRTSDMFQNLPVYDLAKIDSHFNKEHDFLFVAIQWNRLNKDRRDVYENLASNKYKFANIISPHSIIHSANIGVNCWISDNVVLEPDTFIGDNVFIKTNAFVGAYTSIENHCFIGANSFVAGGCHIGEQAFIGVSATIFDQVTIGEKSIIGATTIIKRDIPPYSLVKSSVENQKVKQYDSQEIEEKLLVSKNVR